MMRVTVLCALAFAALAFAGCGPRQAALPGTASVAAVTQRGSWMASDAKKLDLLYVSDYQTDDVDVYSYPAGKLSGVLKGVLKGFPLQAGLCSDNAGNVFIPDSANSSVLEYAHGSTKLARSLLDTYRYPYSCAVDPNSGDLAVVDLESLSGAGGVSIYANAHGAPKFYSYGFIFKYYFAAYDDRGDLFADATFDVPSQPTAFVELPKGAKALQSISLDCTIAIAGGVSWDGTHVVVADSKSSTLYRFKIAGSAGTVVGTTKLEKGRFLAQYVLDSGSLSGAEFHGKSLGFWKFPAGGAPVKSIGGLGEPFGVTLSRAPNLDVIGRPAKIAEAR